MVERVHYDDIGHIGGGLCCIRTYMVRFDGLDDYSGNRRYCDIYHTFPQHPTIPTTATMGIYHTYNDHYHGITAITTIQMV